MLGALAPVLVPTEPGERRSVVVVFPILAQSVADRQTQNAEWAADMGETLRNRAGVKTRAKDQTSIARTRSLDAKLATGNALVRPYAVACVTVPKTLRIAEFGRRLDASIRRAGFAPLRLDLAQDAGFAAATIPLGIGARPEVRAVNRRSTHDRAGRGVGRLLADFGHDLPTRPGRRAAATGSPAVPAGAPPRATASRAGAGRRRRHRCRCGG